jgi:hypothetical protein
MTADTSFDAGHTFGESAKRPSGSATTGFYRPGERSESGAPFEVIPTTCPEYLGPPTGRAGNDEEKCGAWQLQAEYLADRLGKNKEETARNWNTVLWIDKHYRVTRTPAEALPPFNIYVGDEISQSTNGTGAPTGLDDEAPDAEVENEGVEFERISVGQTEAGTGSKRRPALYRQSAGSVRVMGRGDDEKTYRLDIEADHYDLLRLVDALEEIDALAKIDVDDLKDNAPPLLPQIDFPSSDQRAESGKIIRMLMVGLRTLWRPVICAIADHATMKSLGQGKGKDVAAAVGRQRVIEGLLIAESIRKGLGRQEFVVRHTLEPSYTVATCLDEIIRGVLARLGGQTLDDRRAAWPPYRDWQGSCCYIDGMRFVPSSPLAGNDNHQSDSADRKAA